MELNLKHPRGTYPRTEVHRAITSAGLKRFYANGGKIWSDGKKFTDEHRAKLREARKNPLSGRQKSQPRKCSYCLENNIKLRGTARKYCSFNCYKKSRVGLQVPWLKEHIIGDKNVNWRGGVTTESRRARASDKYRVWRRTVFIRDEFTCQDCGAKKTYIEAHHIKSFCDYPELRFDINNGKTLCKPCHAKTDNYMGRARRKIRK